MKLKSNLLDDVKYKAHEIMELRLKWF